MKARLHCNVRNGKWNDSAASRTKHTGKQQLEKEPAIAAARQSPKLRCQKQLPRKEATFDGVGFNSHKQGNINRTIARKPLVKQVRELCTTPWKIFKVKLTAMLAHTGLCAAWYSQSLREVDTSSTVHWWLVEKMAYFVTSSAVMPTQGKLLQT